MNDELASIVARIPAWNHALQIQVECTAGLTNANYRVTVDGERFILRVSGKNTERLGVNRHYEAEALETAAALGLGPEVLAFLFPEGHLVTRRVEGRHLDPAEFRTPEHVRLLTETVKRVHGMPRTGAVFSPFRRVEAYIETADISYLQLKAERQDVPEISARIAPGATRANHLDRLCAPTSSRH